jgi:hypothetical protein
VLTHDKAKQQRVGLMWKRNQAPLSSASVPLNPSGSRWPDSFQKWV